MSEATETTPAPDVTIPDYLQRLLEQIADREGFTDFSITSQPGSNIGDGFQGIMLSVVIAGTRNSKADDELVLICKIPPKSEYWRVMALTSFKQEIHAYDEILPEIVKFQREKGVGEEEGFFSFPKCYGTYAHEETYEFAIVLEDLRHTGYRMWNKYKPIDFNHIKLAMTELGKFHAMSFAIRAQKPELFEEFKKSESFMKKNLEVFPQSVDFFCKSYKTAADTLREDDTEARRKISQMEQNLVQLIQKMANGKLAEPYSVLCHGDFWNNNMMFQYASEDSLVPLKACLIDWQMVQYCSPATDLCYYIYSSTEQKVRTEHFDDILQEYHRNLATLLKRLGGNAAEQFPADELQNQLRKFGAYGMVLAPILVQIVTVPANELPDMDELTLENNDDFDLMKNGNAVGYDVRMSDVIRDFVGRGFFSDEVFEVAR